VPALNFFKFHPHIIPINNRSISGRVIAKIDQEQKKKTQAQRIDQCMNQEWWLIIGKLEDKPVWCDSMYYLVLP
jgi:hypothetical protein